MQQRGIFAFAQDPSAALTPTAPLAKAMIIIKLKARFRITNELYLARRTAVKISCLELKIVYRRDEELGRALRRI